MVFSKGVETVFRLPGDGFPASRRPVPGTEKAENPEKLGKNGPLTGKIAEFRVFVAVYGLLFSDDRL
jgi:hypothetical protein